VKSLAYDANQRILEIAFKSGQVWQLAGVPAAIYQELRHSTISSFLKFIAQRYKASPVRTTPSIPRAEKCVNCSGDMTEKHRTGDHTSTFVRVLWHCAKRERATWRSYGDKGVRQRRGT